MVAGGQDKMVEGGNQNDEGCKPRLQCVLLLLMAQHLTYNTAGVCIGWGTGYIIDCIHGDAVLQDL